jgi:cellobiose phosphorylase
MKYGYFDDNRSEYVITSSETPSPWINDLKVNIAFCVECYARRIDAA